MYTAGDILIGDRIGKRARDKYMLCACKLCGAEIDNAE